MKASDNLFPSILTVPSAVDGSAIGTPASGDYRLFMGVDGNLYAKDDADVVTQLTGGSGGVTIKVNGVDITTQTLLNLTDTASVTWDNPSGGVVEATSTGGGGGTAVAVVKSGDQSNTTTTLANDSELKFAIAASEVWSATFNIYVDSPTAADMKCTITAPTGATGQWGDPTFNGETANFGTTQVIGTAGPGLAIPVIFPVGVINGANAGFITFQFAQQTSNATACIVKLGSNLIAVKQ